MLLIFAAGGVVAVIYTSTDKIADVLLENKELKKEKN